MAECKCGIDERDCEYHRPEGLGWLAALVESGNWASVDRVAEPEPEVTLETLKEAIAEVEKIASRPRCEICGEEVSGNTPHTKRVDRRAVYGPGGELWGFTKGTTFYTHTSCEWHGPPGTWKGEP